MSKVRGWEGKRLHSGELYDETYGTCLRKYGGLQGEVKMLMEKELKKL